VPGAPRNVVAIESFQITWHPPLSDGGSPVLEYRVYIDGTLAETIAAPETVSVDSVSAGSVVRVSAVNAVGEGPKSDPVVAVA
jgi:levanase